LSTTVEAPSGDKPRFALAMVHQHVFEMWLATLSEHVNDADVDIVGRKDLKKSCATLRVSDFNDFNRWVVDCFACC
jgi:hypothetical protein